MPTNTFKVGEMLNRRTRNSKTWLNFDGSYTTEIHMGDVHFDDEHGNLHNINTDLFDEADFDIIEDPVAREGADRFRQSKKEAKTAKAKGVINRDLFNYQGLKVPFDCHIPRIFKRGYTIGKGQDKLTFKPVGASTAKGFLDQDDRSKISYQDAWNDADVELQVLDNGIKETIILKTDRAPVKFSFKVNGPLKDDLTAGALKLRPAWLEDANGEKRDVSQVVRRADGKTYVDLSADVTGLVYPITIDPTVTIQPDGTAGKDAYIESYSGNSNRGGNTWMSLLHNPSQGDYVHMLLQFDLTSISGIVETAYLDLYMYDGAQASTHPVNIFPISENWDEGTVTWYSKPTFNSSIIDENSMYFYPNNQFYSFVCTNSIRENINNNYGFYIMPEDSYTEYITTKKYYSSDYSSYRPKLTVTYNEPPTAPTVTAPNGGETWNAEHTITWNAATDPDSTSLQYHIQLSTDNGVNWKDIVALTTSGVTSYDYDFINEAESSTCLIRIRAYDGTSYGPWDTSDGVFTIQHNQAPTAPTNLSPNGATVDRAKVNRFSWQHNDANADPQAQFDFDWRVQGASTWNTITQATVNQYYDVPANTFPRGNIEWRVRTYDQAGLSSPYSDAAVIFAGDKPANPTITSPTDGSTVAFANPTVQWSSVGQVGYHLKVLDAVDALLWETKPNSTNKAQTIQYDLQNGSAYKIQLAIKNTDGLWSDFVTSNITVSYTPPAKATITASTDEDRDSISISITNPTPAGTEPSVSNNSVFRRKQGDTVWVRIKTGVPTNGLFTDYTPASAVTYEFKVRTWGENGTFTDSDVIVASITVSNVIISRVSDPSQYVKLMVNPGRSEKTGRDRAISYFAGREDPVPEFSDQRMKNLDASFLITETADLNILRTLADCGETLLYRDERGRREFVSIAELNISDQAPNFYELSIPMTKISHEEEV